MASGKQQQNGTAVAEETNQFDVVSDYSDHVYAIYKPIISSGSRVNNKIMREWKSLRKDLPESIYVRVYEKRIDLLRAVIVGAAGTPYHDGLFFFDFYFPMNYPHDPPKVTYKSFGMRLNPNLYENGIVCLSLLNTWSGPRWDHTKSTILQVLVSLQALVLNERPFYNEPIFHGRKTKLLEKKSREYNSTAFVLSCKTMVFLLRRPPRNFGGFVVQHFRGRARNILTACQAYMNGLLRVGQYQENGSFLPKRVKISKKFTRSMEEQYPLLVAEFSKIDPSLNEFLVQLNQMVRETADKSEQKTLATSKNDKGKTIKKGFKLWNCFHF